MQKLPEPPAPAPAHEASRRQWLALALGAGFAAGLGALAPNASFAQTTARGWRIPGGFEPGRRLWLGYDKGHEGLWLALLRLLAPWCPLGLLLPDLAAREAAQAAIREAGLADEVLPKLRYAIAPASFFFVRDAVVLAQGPKGELGALDLRWSAYGTAGWCAWRHAGDPAALATCVPAFDARREGLDVAIARALKARVFTSPRPLALEGGGVESNGAGTLLANEAYVRQRNPGRSKAQLESAYRAWPGVRQVIWLPAGLAEDPQMRRSLTAEHVGWGTGGHTDEFVRFADARTVLLAWPQDEDVASHPVARLSRERMAANLAVLRAARNAQGERLRVLQVPMPKPVQRPVTLRSDADTGWSEQWRPQDFRPEEGRREGDVVQQLAVASYLNFVNLPNVGGVGGGVLLPDYLPHGTPPAQQANVAAVFQQAFPGQRLHFFDAMALNWYGGGLHCATLNEP
jgi:agmatine deiminase